VKLVVDEAESTDLRDLAARTDAVSCSLLRTELRRAVARVESVDLRPLAELLLDDVGMLSLGDAMLDRAGALSPSSLRSLDAIHLTAALRVADLIDAVVTYDARLAEAARLHGLEVWSPGAAV